MSRRLSRMLIIDVRKICQSVLYAFETSCFVLEKRKTDIPFFSRRLLRHEQIFGGTEKVAS